MRSAVLIPIRLRRPGVEPSSPILNSHSTPIQDQIFGDREIQGPLPHIPIQRYSQLLVRSWGPIWTVSHQ